MIRFAPRLKEYDLEDPSSKKEYNEKVFAAVAPRYDLITRILSFGRDRTWKKRMIRSLPPPGPLRALDLACGTGDIAWALARRYPSGEIVAVDLSPEMIRLARRRSDSSIVRFEQGDMSRIAYPDGYFDVVTGGYALRNAPDLGQLLVEIHRVLKPGGMAAFLDFSKSGHKILQAGQLFLLKRWGGVWGYLFHRNPEVYGYIASSLEVFPDRLALMKMIGNCGFRDVHCRLFFLGFTALITFRKP